MKPEKSNGKLKTLKGIISDLDSVVVAFSGGVDSTLLAKLSHDVLGEKALAVTASSETYPPHELEAAKRLAKEIGITHLIIETKELEIEGFSDNPPERCYFCKSELFGKLRDIAESEGYASVADGANLDDTQDYRPGSKAAEELGVRSPLKEAGMTKDDIRVVSEELGLTTWDKPAYACMSSRFPYGEEITLEGLARVSAAEDFLREMGFGQFRVRHHRTIARLELAPEDFSTAMDKRTEIIDKLKEIGYTYVTLDLQGYRTGSMNEVLNK
ncbi:MAG: ATP-dependent sacrificial sulfur transferase LarE, partial [Candidatus Brocadiales bacterium]|nr:ATP-dependent sacrificial sulfur transferase LarE [Candidatus Bathyanammoxibius sp.]